MRYIFLILFMIVGCSAISEEPSFIYEINPPKGYKRETFSQKEFSGFLQNMKLKKKKELLTYTNKNIFNNYNTFAVLDLPILFNQDLEQCADYSMRLWAEFHKKNKNLENLFLFNYGGDKLYYKNSNKTYLSFLRNAFAYSNSYSIKMGCKPINKSDLIPGDLIVQNDTGGIGHVSIIFDKCISKKGDSLYLIGYSFMPAQEIHIEKAIGLYGNSGWFTIDGYIKYLNKYLPYGKPVFRRY